MARMRGLCEVQVDLDAYLESETLSPQIEAEVFEPMLAVTKASHFVVHVSWPSDTNHLFDIPFRIIRPSRCTQSSSTGCGSSIHPRLNTYDAGYKLIRHAGRAPSTSI